jgi:hypothetical protein
MYAAGDLGTDSLCIKAPVQGGISVASGHRHLSEDRTWSPMVVSILQASIVHL